MDQLSFWIGYTVLAVCVGLVARNRGHDGLAMFAVSMVLSPVLGFIIELVRRPNVGKVEAKTIQDGTKRKCPMCAELIRRVVAKLLVIALVSPLLANAENSCDSAELIRQYDAGELSTTRDSTLFDHQIRVTRFCDEGRPIDIEDVFAQIDATETTFHDLFGRSIILTDGTDRNGSPLTLEVLVGICERDGDEVDCAIGDFCSVRLGWTSDRICQDFGGRSYPNARNAVTNRPHSAAHLAVVPWLAEGESMWVVTNRYANFTMSTRIFWTSRTSVSIDVTGITEATPTGGLKGWRNTSNGKSSRTFSPGSAAMTPQR